MSIPFHSDFIHRVQHDSFLPSNFLEVLDSVSPTSIRKHPRKTPTHFENETPIPWCENGFYLAERPLFTLDPLFHAGSYYPQEAGSMLLDTVLKAIDLPLAPKILDLCAAPGGKSTLVASFLNGKGMLVSNEVINQRAKILKETISKWGYTNCIVTNNDPSDFERLTSFFDVTIIDAPCSGEGMFRKDPNARTEWSTENVELCAGRQKRIIADSWNTLKNGGYLIYSTCTFNEQENEQTISWILEEFDAELVELKLPKTFTVGRNGIGAYGIPGTSKTEGFYLAVVQKKEDSDSIKSTKNNSSLSRQKELFDVEQFATLSECSIFNWNDNLLAVPKELESEFLFIQSQMHIIKWGTNLGEIARKGIIPHQDLALNPSLISFPNRIEVSKQEALEYLHGDTFKLEGSQGFQLITQQQEPLGWIKHLGNRFNNLYPKEWRIRMNVK